MSRLISAQSALLNALSTMFTPAREGDSESERGDVPGWVLVTLMTAGLVTLLWRTAGPLLQELFTSAVSGVSGS